MNPPGGSLGANLGKQSGDNGEAKEMGQRHGGEEVKIIGDSINRDVFWCCWINRRKIHPSHFKKNFKLFFESNIEYLGNIKLISGWCSAKKAHVTKLAMFHSSTTNERHPRAYEKKKSDRGVSNSNIVVGWRHGCFGLVVVLFVGDWWCVIWWEMVLVFEPLLNVLSGHCVYSAQPLHY